MTDFITRPTFSEGFAKWFNEASLEELADAYCENYKDAHGIKARWVRGDSYDRNGWADAFVRLGQDIREENEREDREAQAFRDHIASLGLTDWAARNGIHNRYDLMDHNDREAWKADREADALT